jgi:hypothetical protein
VRCIGLAEDGVHWRIDVDNSDLITIGLSKFGLAPGPAHSLLLVSRLLALIFRAVGPGILFCGESYPWNVKVCAETE